MLIFIFLGNIFINPFLKNKVLNFGCNSSNAFKASSGSIFVINGPNKAFMYLGIMGKYHKLANKSNKLLSSKRVLRPGDNCFNYIFLKNYYDLFFISNPTLTKKRIIMRPCPENAIK